MLWNFLAKASYSSSPILAALTSFESPFASTSPTSTAWITLSQRSILLLALSLIYLALGTPNVFVNIT